MSFLFADRKKQIAVVNTPVATDPSGLFITGSLDLLNHTAVTGLANATLVGNLNEAANLVYPTNRGSLTYYNGLVIEGLPHIALSPMMGTKNVSTGFRDKGIGIGLGYSIVSSARIYNLPTAVVDIAGSNADIKITGGEISTAGTASLIMVGAKANNAIIQGFKIDSIRTTSDPAIDEASLHIRPYDINTNLNPLVSLTHDGNVGIGTSTPSSTLHVVSSLPSVSAVSIESTTGPGLTVKTNATTPFRVITGYPINEAIALHIAGDGKVGVKVDPTGLVSNIDNKLALAVNGSIRATNSVFAFGTFSYAAGVFAKKDHFNVDGISVTASTITINFLDSITNFDSLKGFSVVATEISGQPIIPYITARTESSLTLNFINSTTGAAATFTEFSFAVFVNTDSLYQTASIVQAVF